MLWMKTQVQVPEVLRIHNSHAQKTPGFEISSGFRTRIRPESCTKISHQHYENSTRVDDNFPPLSLFTARVEGALYPMFGLQNVCFRVLSIRWFSTHSCVTSMLQISFVPRGVESVSILLRSWNVGAFGLRSSVRLPVQFVMRNLSSLNCGWMNPYMDQCDFRVVFCFVISDPSFFQSWSTVNSIFSLSTAKTEVVPVWILGLRERVSYLHTCRQCGTCSCVTSTRLFSLVPRHRELASNVGSFGFRSILSSRLVDSAWRSFLCTTAEEFSTYGSTWTRRRFLSFVICSLIRMHVDISLTELATCWCLAILTFGCMPIFTLGSFLAISFPDMNVRWIVLFAGSACICGRCRMFSFFFRLATFFSESEFVKKNGFFYAVMLFFQVARETARISFVTLALCGALHTVSDDFWMLLLFLCLCLSLSLFAGVPQRGFSSMPFLALKWNYLIFCSTSLWTTSLRLSWLYDLPLIRVIWLQTCIKYPQRTWFFKLHPVQTLQKVVSKSVRHKR